MKEWCSLFVVSANVPTSFRTNSSMLFARRKAEMLYSQQVGFTAQVGRLGNFSLNVQIMGAAYSEFGQICLFLPGLVPSKTV